MRILIALGGNALLRRGEPMTMAHQIANIRRAAQQIARLADGNQLIVAHGNGPRGRPAGIAGRHRQVRLVRRPSMYSTPNRKA